MSKIKPNGKQVAQVSKKGLKKSEIKPVVKLKGNKNTAVSKDYSFARTN